MKYDKCDFSLFGYYIHDVIFEHGKLVLLCTYEGKEEKEVCFTGVTNLEGKELLYGSTVKYMTIAKRRSGTCYKVLFIEHSESAILCARNFINEKADRA